MRYLPYIFSLFASLILLFLGILSGGAWWIPLPLTAGLALLGTWDLFQNRHSLLRNYPISAHVRWLIESVRPELRQYLLESETDGTPFPRVQRALIYQRAKGVNDKIPFGTQLDASANGYEWLNPSIVPSVNTGGDFRISIGNEQCRQPYSASVLNISAMSFGSLSGAAIRALNKAAQMGGFAQDTGEGGISAHHRLHGGDLIWEIGSGYFGCRDAGGSFCPDRFAEQARDPQVKMVEVKLSQGAKPGHGGILPGAKVTAEIAAARGVSVGRDCVSPATHSAFSTPVELMEFIGRLRDLSGGKPAGFKMCIGHGWEFLALCKAMLQTGIYPDFIVIDGAEGGTGAAPLELTNHVGTPLREGLIFAHNALVGSGLRSHVKIGASGKVTSGFGMAANMALGADWCNSARGFMFSLGCIQSRSCHTDRCPSGIATQNPTRERGLVVPEKAERARRFHQATVAALAEVVASGGLMHPSDLRPVHISRRMDTQKVHTLDQVYDFLRPGELLDGTSNPAFESQWALAQADSFRAGG
jgi:glutamate synthase domain-containing protein 2